MDIWTMKKGFLILSAIVFVLLFFCFLILTFCIDFQYKCQDAKIETNHYRFSSFPVHNWITLSYFFPITSMQVIDSWLFHIEPLDNLDKDCQYTLSEISFLAFSKYKNDWIVISQSTPQKTFQKLEHRDNLYAVIVDVPVSLLSHKEIKINVIISSSNSKLNENITFQHSIILTKSYVNFIIKYISGV